MLLLCLARGTAARVSWPHAAALVCSRCSMWCQRSGCKFQLPGTAEVRRGHCHGLLPCLRCAHSLPWPHAVVLVCSRCLMRYQRIECRFLLLRTAGARRRYCRMLLSWLRSLGACLACRRPVALTLLDAVSTRRMQYGFDCARGDAEARGLLHSEDLPCLDDESILPVLPRVPIFAHRYVPCGAVACRVHRSCRRGGGGWSSWARQWPPNAPG